MQTGQLCVYVKPLPPVEMWQECHQDAVPGVWLLTLAGHEAQTGDLHAEEPA